MTDKQLLEQIVKGQKELRLEVSRIRKTVREEVEIEAKKTRDENFMGQRDIEKQIEELGDNIKDLRISNNRLVKGQEELKIEQQEQGRVLNEHGKSLMSIKKKLDKTYKIANYIALDFDERIVNIDKRTDRIENHLSLPTQKPKH